MKRKPRRDVILLRFMAGESAAKIMLAYWRSPLRINDVEQIIRDALNGRTRIP